MAIMSLVSPEFKILQEELAQIQKNMYGVYILEVGSNLFTWDRVGLPLSLYQKSLFLF